jgi:hypothetical protein
MLARSRQHPPSYPYPAAWRATHASASQRRPCSHRTPHAAATPASRHRRDRQQVPPTSRLVPDPLAGLGGVDARESATVSRKPVRIAVNVWACLNVSLTPSPSFKAGSDVWSGTPRATAPGTPTVSAATAHKAATNIARRHSDHPASRASVSGEACRIGPLDTAESAVGSPRAFRRIAGSGRPLARLLGTPAQHTSLGAAGHERPC